MGNYTTPKHALIHLKSFEYYADFYLMLIYDNWEYLKL